MEASGSLSLHSRHASALPCDECRKSKMKCDRSRPICGTCDDRRLTCVYSRSDASRGDRVRQFHRKSKSGCSACKARRVRCDEKRPICGACSRRGQEELCVFPCSPDVGSSDEQCSRQVVRSAGLESRVDGLSSKIAFKSSNDMMSDTIPIDGVISRYLMERIAKLPGTLNPVARSMDRGLGSLSDWTVGFVAEPDPLACFFPTILERQQFQHFIFDTAQSLLVIPVSQQSNPWLTFLAPLAIGKAKGVDAAHDAFRSSLLSLATSDLAIKMIVTTGTDNSLMQAASAEHWRQAVAEMQLAIDLGLHLEDGGAADMLLAAAIALGTRDRLACWSEWEQPLDLGRRVLKELGGPDLYIAADTAPLRRFLAEQLVSIEILGCLTTFKEPNIGDWYNHWLSTASVEENDHLGTIYGWDRQVIAHCLRGLSLAGQYVRLWELRQKYLAHPSLHVQEKLNNKLADCRTRLMACLTGSRVSQLDGSAIKSLSPTGSRSFCLQACVDLYLLMILTEGDRQDVLDTRVSVIFDIANEVMSRGEVSGLLLPVTWAQACAGPTHRESTLKLLKQLGVNYHMDRLGLSRVVDMDWAGLGDIFPTQWEIFARREGLYFPVY